MSDFRDKQTLESGLHYDFNEWLEMFKSYDDLIKQGNNLVVTISTHWATSGYWIEIDKNQQSNSVDKVYRGEEIEALRQRVTDEIDQSALDCRSPKFTT